MHTMSRIFAIVLMLLAFAGVIAFLYLSPPNSRTQPSFATVWPKPKPLPDFNLTDQSGNAFERNNLRGQWSLLFFGFTNCPDICPATLQQLAVANNRLKESGNPTADIILVSVDPERDTPDVLARYVSHFGGEIRGVTGNLVELKKLTSSAGIFFEKSTLPDGGYSVDHSAAVIVINERAEIYASFSAPHITDEFISDLPILMGSN